MGQFLYQYRYFIFLLIAGSHLLFGWPGIISLDASLQYSQAVSGIYADANPPMMAFVWRYFNMIYPGPGLMFLLQTGLLYGSIWLILKSSERVIPFKKHPFFLLGIFFISLIPQVFLYSFEILKDLPFSFSFLMIAAILCRATTINKPLSWINILIIIILLIYGIGVKYQAQFCAVILLGWIFFLQSKFYSKFRALGQVFLIGIFAYGSAIGLHKTLVPNAQSDHFWERVKLFDLAALSISQDKDLIPDSNKTHLYTFSTAKEKFKPNIVDPLMSILKHSPSEELRDHLWNTWAKEVLNHPFYYLKHRATNLAYLLLGRLQFDWVQSKVEHTFKISLADKPFIKNILDLFGFIFLSQIWLFVFACFYLYLGLRYFRMSPCAQILLGFNSLGLSIAGLIFFLSMASCPRYTYLMPLMVQASHIFALGLYLDLKKGKTLGKGRN